MNTSLLPRLLAPLAAVALLTGCGGQVASTDAPDTATGSTEDATIRAASSQEAAAGTGAAADVVVTAMTPSGSVTSNPSGDAVGYAIGLDKDEEAVGELPTWYQDTPDWVRAGAQKMLDTFYFCDGGTGTGGLYGTVITSTSAVHFGGCRTTDGGWDGGATVYMQPSPYECGWTFVYQTVCEGEEVTLVWQLDPARGFVPDLDGVTQVDGPDFELAGRQVDTEAPLLYRYLGDTQLGYSTLDD